MEIKELHIETDEMNAFWALPNKIYPANSHFFLVPEKINSAVKHRVFGIFQQEELLARAVLYFNKKLVYQQQQVAVFGNYEALEAATPYIKAFVDFLSAEAKAWGASYLIGPMNGSSWEDYRLPEDIMHSFFLEPYHQPYYIQQLEVAGLQKMETYTSYKAVQLETALTTFENGLSANPLFNKIQFRKIDCGNFRQELEALYPLMSVAFHDALLYTPLQKEGFIKKFESYQSVVNQEFTLIAEDEAGVPRACFFCVDNRFAQEKQLVIKTIARQAGDEWKSLGQLIGYEIYKKAIAADYKAIIHALMHQDAVSVNLSQRYEGEPLNTYYLLGKPLE